MLRATAAGSLFCLAACGGRTLERAPGAAPVADAGPSNAEGGAPPPAALALARAECSLKARCNGAALDAFDGDLDLCAARTSLLYASWLAAPDTTLAALDLARCASELGDLACDRFRENDLPASCDSVGRRTVGRSCFFSGQCTTGYCRRFVDQSQFLCGVCADRKLVDQSCDASYDECSPGTTCDGQVCDPFGAPSDPCPCAPTAYCDGGQCRFFAQQGEECAGAYECDAGNDEYCEPSTGTCQKRPLIRQGDTCDGIAVCSDGQCIVSNLTAPVCKPWLDDGSPCTDALGSFYCRSPAVCIRDICTVPEPSLCP